MIGFQTAKDYYHKKHSSLSINGHKNPFEKISSMTLDKLISFFSSKEFIEYSFIAKVFKNKLFSCLSIKENHYSLFIKYWKTLSSLYSLSKDYSSYYVNVFFTKNIFNIEIRGKRLSLEEQNDIHINSLTYFLSYVIKERLNKKILVSIESFENYSLYYHVLSNLSQLIDELEVDICFPCYFSNFSYLTNLFNLITNIKPIKTERDISRFIYIQELRMERNDEQKFMYYYITNSNIKKSIDYFSVNNNRIKQLIYIEQKTEEDININSQIEQVIKLNKKELISIKGIKINKKLMEECSGITTVKKSLIDVKEIVNEKNIVKLTYLLVNGNSKECIKVINKMKNLIELGIEYKDIKDVLNILKKISIDHLKILKIKNQSASPINGEILSMMISSKVSILNSLECYKEIEEKKSSSFISFNKNFTFSLQEKIPKNQVEYILSLFKKHHCVHSSIPIELIITHKDASFITSILHSQKNIPLNSLTINTSKISGIKVNTFQYSQYCTKCAIMSINLNDKSNLSLIEDLKPTAIRLDTPFKLNETIFTKLNSFQFLKIILLSGELKDYDTYLTIKAKLSNKYIFKSD